MVTAAPITPNHHGAASAAVVASADGVVRLQNEHWLDYDLIAVAVLVMGISFVIQVALSI